MAGEYHSLKKQQYLNLIKECAHSGKNKRTLFDQIQILLL